MNLTDTETLILLEALKSVIFTSESERRVSVKVERKLKRWLDAPDCRFEHLAEHTATFQIARLKGDT
tara:strand:+ start:148 stop:348 length:201 start_codon:yes stop_codon:yes gene_type:complete